MNKSFPLYRYYRQKLQRSELFHNLSLETLDDMLKRFRFETWNKGSQHDARLALRRFYVIVEGRMELVRINPETGRSFTLMILKEGDVYDVLSLLDGREHDAIPVALDHLKLLSAPIDSVREWLHCHPEFNQNLMPHLSQCVRLREEIASDLVLHDTPTRLARVILRHIPVDLDESESNSGIKAELLHDLSNEQLAQLVGSVRQVVNSHLGKMKKEGLIHIDQHQIIVDDLRRLKAKAEVMHGQLQQHL